MIKRKQDYPPLELSVGNSEFPTGCRAQFNGNISEIQWKNAQTATLSAYGFTYDKLNRLKTSHYGEGTTGTTNSGHWDEDLSYDFNGNIMSLVRDAAGTNVDNLTYNYSGTGNKLNYVSDGASYSGEENHFKDGNQGTTTDYTYDTNGNMNQDKNKGITGIAYNYLNLPRLIDFGGGKTIEYIYDATGVKLQKVVTESGTPKTTDYVGGVVYEGNVRKFMSTEEGRIMLESTPEYQYHMKDHLGNVRLTFTTASSAQQTSTYLATMETEVTTLEAATFNNIEETQTEDKIYNHTPGGKASARLNAVEDRVMGPSMTLQVMPGDTVRMKVQAKYFKKAKSKDPIAGMASIVAASMGAGTISEAPQIAQGIQETLGLGQAGLVSKDNTIPKAYINYLFFDKENNFKKGGYKQVSEAALGSFEELDLEYVPEEEGTMMIYTANQTAEDLDVYMDDLTILHTEGPIIRVDDYYPFGLTYHTSERTGYTTNNFLYNGKELQTDLDLDWYDYGARMYDASIGRFNRIDRFSNMYYGLSPYNYGANNPILFVDVNGDSLHITGTAEETIALLAARADACGCKLNVTGSTNDDGTLSYSITGFESTDDDFAEIQNDLQDIIDSPEIITEIIVKTDPSKLDKVEEMGGSYYDPESNTIIHADSWLSGEWSNIPAPSYRYAVDKAANSGDKLAFWIMDFFVEPENNPYSARKRRLIPFSEAIAHESQHAAEDVRGKLLPKDKQYSGYRSDVEHNAINTVNKMRERKGIPLRKTR